MGKSTKNAIIAYNIHFKGQEIVNHKLDTWNRIVSDDTNPELRDILCEFNENDLACLNDILEQFAKH